MKSLKKQFGGDHYKNMGIQPLEFCAKNMTEEEIIGVVKKDVTKYIWRVKDGIAIDWGKAKHLIDWGLEALGLTPKEEAEEMPAAKPYHHIFPKTTFAQTNNGYDQLNHMVQEAREFIEAHEAFLRDPSNQATHDHMMDEATDFVHSRETYGQIREDNAMLLRQSEQRVFRKNQNRGYYLSV